MRDLKTRFYELILQNGIFTEECEDNPTGWALLVILDENKKTVAVFDTMGAEHIPVEGKTINLIAKILHIVEEPNGDFGEYLAENPNGEVLLIIFDESATEVERFDTRTE